MTRGFGVFFETMKLAFFSRSVIVTFKEKNYSNSSEGGSRYYKGVKLLVLSERGSKLLIHKSPRKTTQILWKKKINPSRLIQIQMRRRLICQGSGLRRQVLAPPLNPCHHFPHILPAQITLG